VITRRRSEGESCFYDDRAESRERVARLRVGQMMASNNAHAMNDMKVTLGMMVLTVPVELFTIRSNDRTLRERNQTLISSACE
jgi:3-phenylpropionate/cinnamic acid dioxygenase small subunit